MTMYASVEQTMPPEFKQIIETNLIGQAYGVMDALLLAIGFQAQRTEEAKSVDAPHNLYHPIDDNRVDGDFGSITFRHSADN